MNYNFILRDWFRQWINIYKKPYIKTWQTIQEHIKNHVPVKLQITRLSELNAFEIQKAINDVPTSRTRVEIFDIYHGSLTTAFKLGLLKSDIASLLVKPKHNRIIGKNLQIGELTAFLYLIKGNRYENYFKFCLLTGCRRSESLMITWEDINLEKRYLHIRGTKTACSDRFLPISQDLFNLLNDIPKTSVKLFNHRKDGVTKAFKKVCPNHKLHDLRHTFATRCFECGIPIRVVQEWLGHTRLDTTAKIYTHVMRDFSDIEMKKFKLID